MSVASMWDEKLRAHLRYHGPDGIQRHGGFMVTYQDIRCLVDDALELEIVRRTPLAARVAELEQQLQQAQTPGDQQALGVRHMVDGAVRTLSRCVRCGRVEDTEGWDPRFIPDEWSLLVAPGDGEGLLCLDCSERALSK